MACTLGWLALPSPNGGNEIPLLDQPKLVLLRLLRLFAAIPIAGFKINHPPPSRRDEAEIAGGLGR